MRLTPKQRRLQASFQQCDTHDAWLTKVNPQKIDLKTAKGQLIQREADQIGIAWMTSDDIYRQRQWLNKQPKP